MLRFAPLLLLGLAACAPPPVSAPQGQRLIVTQPPADEVACRADEFQGLMGLSSDDLLEIEILGPVRVIRPNQAVTLEFIANRLNIELSSEDIVIRVYCG
ncbi:MAG: I78 family peptidase inhibitor [Rhodobacteraceae bacterium]|nr:I78 family peptidase inhibitor [Paracoccaceae bacterium]